MKQRRGQLERASARTRRDALVGEGVEGDVVESPAEPSIVDSERRVEDAALVDVDWRVDGNARDEETWRRRRSARSPREKRKANKLTIIEIDARTSDLVSPVGRGRRIGARRVSLCDDADDGQSLRVELIDGSSEALTVEERGRGERCRRAVDKSDSRVHLSTKPERVARNVATSVEDGAVALGDVLWG